MQDRFKREIDTLRISLTNSCNQHCFYCRGKDSCLKSSESKLLSFQQIVEVVKAALTLGIKRFKLTGGEPLLREGVVELVGLLSALPGVNDLSMTTNGVLLNRFAAELARAGLDRVNVSVDSLNEERYREITGGGELKEVLQGVERAQECGLTPVKLNTVYMEEINGDEIEQIRAFCRENGLKHQLINRMDIHDDKQNYDNFTVTDRPPRCSACSRLRLTADGKLLPCLFSGRELSLGDYATIEEALREAIESKPAEGQRAGRRIMNEIGG